eukprot:SAG11_NODE_2001_length_3939_cov_26.376672_4_plen_58_part_00
MPQRPLGFDGVAIEARRSCFGRAVVTLKDVPAELRRVLLKLSTSRPIRIRTVRTTAF